MSAALAAGSCGDHAGVFTPIPPAPFPRARRKRERVRWHFSRAIQGENGGAFHGEGVNGAVVHTMAAAEAGVVPAANQEINRETV